ncbi:MAG TPA: sulfite exporter TauE/SafE family protein [Acidobacteriaceae bacterium]|jgi:sulfite exporter TauE/SafE|nr:sulfite exporter TauE/SafE family protein [Acidobacteriaceae bacterium]
MAVLPLSTSAVEALVLGLATGPVCLASCGPVVLPWMLVQPRGVRGHARQMSLFLAARLVGYLVFAAAIWFAGIALSRSWSGRSWLFGGVQVLLAAGLLIYAAGWPRARCSIARPRQELVQIGGASVDAARPRATGALVLGFLTGINLCPPFLVAGVQAAGLPSLAQALLFFAIFFAGTAVWFMPFVSLGVVRRTSSFITVARMAAALLACWYGFTGASLLIEKAIYG